MGPDRKSDIMHWLRKGKQPIGIFLLLALLWGGVLFPLGQRIGRGCQQQRQLQQRLQHLAAFARSWDPQETREEASHLTKVRKKREAPVSRENWLEALTQTAENSQIRCLRLLPLESGEKTGEAGIDVVLEGPYPGFLLFFRQWEETYPGTWIWDGRLESRENGKKLLFQGKFFYGPIKSSKGREIGRNH